MRCRPTSSASRDADESGGEMDHDTTAEDTDADSASASILTQYTTTALESTPKTFRRFVHNNRNTSATLFSAVSPSSHIGACDRCSVMLTQRLQNSATCNYSSMQSE